MKFKNKFLLLIILTFSFILFFNINNAKAYTCSVNEDNTYFKINYTVNDVEYVSPNIPIKYLNNGFLIWHSPNNNDKEITICKNKNEDCFLINNSLSSITYSNKDLMYCNYSKGVWRDCSQIELSTGRIVVCSSHEVKKSDGTIFFQNPVVEKRQGVLAPLLETKEMEKTNLQIRVIIPLIIVVVVSFLGLRKALQMLSTILRRS